jgi:hypothetical protein
VRGDVLPRTWLEMVAEVLAELLARNSNPDRSSGARDSSIDGLIPTGVSKEGCNNPELWFVVGSGREVTFWVETGEEVRFIVSEGEGSREGVGDGEGEG